MTPRRTTFAAATIALALFTGACSDSDDDAADETTTTEVADETTTTAAAEEEPAADEPGTIVDVASEAGGFATLVAAVDAAGLVETLSGDGPFTVFAPTDDAFAAALTSLGITAEELLADKDKLTSILTYHVVAGEVPSSTVVTMNGKTATTVNGADVTVTVDGDKVKVNDANVTDVDIDASNGVIHVIDAVLLPPAS